MKFKTLSLLIGLLTLHSLSTHAENGGHTGNGGGVVECPGKSSIVLDYYEALQKGEELLDFEMMSRDEFFDLMIKRLALGSNTRRPYNLLDDMIGGGNGGIRTYEYDIELTKAVKTQKNIDEWPEMKSWRVKDEFVDDNLPEGCHFEQAAISITVKHQPYRIKAITDHLSHGQKLILELHEFLNQINDAGTSINVRELVRVLITKKTNYATLRVAVSRFTDPSQDYIWKRRNLHIYNPENESHSEAYDELPGLYALDLRGKTPQEKKIIEDCPHWVGIVPANRGNMVMQLFQDNAVEPDNLILPMKRIDLLKKTIIGEHQNNNYRRGILNSKTKTVDWDIEIFSPSSSSKFFEFQRSGGPRCRYLSVARNIELFSKPYESFRQMKKSMEKELFPRLALVTWQFGISTYVKHIRNYYEEKRLGIENEFEDQIQEVRKFLEW